MCCNMPHGTTYIGGVAAVVNSYIMHSGLFGNKGYAAELFDYQNHLISKIPFTPLRTMLYGIGQKRQLKKLLCKKEGNIVHIHTSRSFLYLKDVWLGRSICRAKIAKLVLTIHVGHIDTVHKYLPRVLQRQALSMLNRYFSKVLFLSERMMHQFIDAGLNEDLCEVLYNFHDIGEMHVDEKQKPLKNLRLLFVGMINRDKGILDLLDAIKRCNNQDITLDICGTITDETIREDYRKRVRELGERVTEWGYVKGKQKVEIFSSADVLVLPSYHEGLPLVVLEALASGCALMLTPVGSLPEILSDENTLWVKPGDVDGIAEAVRTLRMNRDLMQKMKIANRAKGKLFSVESHIRGLCDLYTKL